MKFKVKNAFYFHGELVSPGDVVDLTEDEIEYFGPKDVLAKLELSEGTEKVGKSGSEILDPRLVSHGGGYYELPNGEKVRGKEAAEQALENWVKEELEKAGGEPGADNHEKSQNPPADTP